MPIYRDALRVVIGIDPAMTSKASSDETGIIVCAMGVDHCGYVLEDLSCRLSPEGWARRVVNAYEDFQCDRIVAEVNNGGDLVETILRTINANVSYQAVRASHGKRVRAEPILSFYEQHRVFHTKPFPELEDQMCNYNPMSYDTSPDRLDALVWALTALMLGPGPAPLVGVGGATQVSHWRS